ncbi:hypothetical protein L227DRAFT_593870 [Lentinus tigrinus ALCF2SS1-6]|uniref:Fe2OG dioxygenase domain-containing protein n=1 Tax=Lentinus tigrinus ALCF2SS1-6 TaxID=1328759 RepID=A0A5C2S875_9APHY|nr:hypothetical protein L227DRAFT_593870 [Lentinus tigrinus ALCF2SS1-6]
MFKLERWTCGRKLDASREQENERHMCFLLYAPKLYAHYERVMSSLLEKNPSLRPLFPNSVFAAGTFNIGPRVATYIHTDHLNYAPGWCAVVALGDFDPRLGGHLVVWDLGLVIEFPPGSLIFLPSAILRHSNVPVQDHETRHSFTQYTAGGLFRWVACGFQTQGSFDAQGLQFDMSGWERWVHSV